MSISTASMSAVNRTRFEGPWLSIEGIRRTLRNLEFWSEHLFSRRDQPSISLGLAPGNLSAYFSAVSASGTLVYSVEDVGGNRELTWVSRTGQHQAAAAA